MKFLDKKFYVEQYNDDKDGKILYCCFVQGGQPGIQAGI